MLMRCVITMLKVEDCVTEKISLRTAPQTFRSICRKVLRAIDKLLQNIEENARGYGLHVDFRDDEFFSRLSGFFGKDLTLETQQAADYENVDKVAPCLGAWLTAAADWMRKQL